MDQNGSIGMHRYERFARSLLKEADIEVDGTRPSDIRVNDARFYRRVLAEGSLGFGESYMDGWWDVASLDACVAKLLEANLDRRAAKSPRAIALAIGARLQNQQNRNRAFEVGERHYDIGNDLYRAMLDGRMTYTCGYWKDATTLDEAQEAKLDLVCRKIGLKKGDRVLDIGCGWGSFAKFAVERYGASVVGITVSKEQLELGRKACAGLPVELRLQDYREMDETFDHVVSLGMFEHVGYKNYRDYMQVAHRCLKAGGFFLLHTIGGNFSSKVTDPWIEKYIFPNSLIPSVAQIGKAVEDLFVMEDWHNFGPDYDRTLMAWHANVQAHWPELAEKYGERFKRMWDFYLLACAATFRTRKNQLWQIVLSKGVAGRYEAVR